MTRRLSPVLVVVVFAGPALAPSPCDAGPIYAGTSTPGFVYQYVGGTTWEAISSTLGDAVVCMAQHDGKLFAGTFYYDASYYSHGQVWRREDDGTWTLVGSGLDDQVCALASYGGYLYAGTAYQGARLYRYDGGTTWTRVVDYSYDYWTGIRSLHVGSDGYLYAGDWFYDLIGRFDGASFQHLADLSGSCIWDFSEYSGAMYAAAYEGRLHRSSDGVNWELVLDYCWTDLWEIEQFRGYLHLGYDDGRFARTDPAGNITQIWTAPNSIISMVAEGSSCLYFGTGAEAIWGGYGSPIGAVYSYDGASDPQLISSEPLGEGVQCLHFPYAFCDVRGEHWAYDYIEACRQAGIVAGYPGGHYRPRWSVSRAQMAVFVARALAGGDEYVPPGPAEASFADVPTDHWAYKYVEYAVSENIAGGFDDGTYRPDLPVDRAQMAVFISRSIATPHGDEGLAGYTPPATPTFSDVPIYHWAYRYVEYVAEAGVASGYGDGSYRPGSVCSRDQMAVFVSRAFGLSP